MKVFISTEGANTRGQRKIRAHPSSKNGGKGTLERLVEKARRSEQFRHLAGEVSDRVVRDDVCVGCLPRHGVEREGRLTVGCGADNGTIGPDLQFGHVLGDDSDEPVLEIEVARGGKSLAEDFRPRQARGEAGESYTALVCDTKDPASGAPAEDSGPPRDFEHPGLLHGREELAFVRSMRERGKEPWASAWEGLREHEVARLSWKPRPRAEVVRGAYNNPNRGADELLRDASAAYAHALQWCLTDDARHAEKAIEILDAYSTTLESVGGHDARLLVGMAGVKLLNAAELLRHTGTGWAVPSRRRFERLQRRVLYPVIEDFYPTANGNWDASMIQTMLAMGIYLDDRAIFERAVDYARKGPGNGAIPKYLNEFGECQESGRDQAHTQMGLGYLACAAEMAWKQGVDLYGAFDSRLRSGYEYTAKYNLGHEVRFEPYRSYQGRYHYKEISGKARGRFSNIYERVYHHYHERRGLEMPYTEEVLERIRPQGWQLEFVSWATLTTARGIAE